MMRNCMCQVISGTGIKTNANYGLFQYANTATIKEPPSCNYDTPTQKNIPRHYNIGIPKHKKRTSQIIKDNLVGF